jgi:DNA-binding transcriptional LysR family regulator
MTRDAKPPSLEVLQTLLEFAERGEVTAAAEAIGLDPAVISRRLGRLRTDYGLLRRIGRSLELTDKGRATLPAIRSLLRQHEQLAGWLQGEQACSQVLAIATGSFGARFYLPRALALFAGQHPDWQVRVQVRRGRDRILGVADGTFDLAIVSHDPAQIRTIVAGARGEPAALRIELLGEHPLCLVAGKDTPFGRELGQVLDGQTAPLSMLTRLPLVGLDRQSGIRRQLEAHVRGHLPSLGFRFEAGGWEAARECAREGLGVAILPAPLLTPDHRKDLIIRRLPPEIRIQDHLIDRDGEAAPAHEAMKRALRESAHRPPPAG